MRPVFCGNFEYETRQSDLERLFSKYGRVERDFKSGICAKGTELRSTPVTEGSFQSFMPMPTVGQPWCLNGFAFVYFEDERDAEDVIRGLDHMPFGYDRRQLSVEWARGERGNHRDGSKSVVNQRPTKTLFVINFDPVRTGVRDIERHFEPYRKILIVRIRRNFAFVQFESQEDATKALDCTHMSKIQDRMVSVEYALKDDSERERDNKYDSPPRRGGRRGGSPYGRSPSPAYHRSRPSPDYGRSHPSLEYVRPRSPIYDRYDAPAAYGRHQSPDNSMHRNPADGRRKSPDSGRYRSRSPIRRPT